MQSARTNKPVKGAQISHKPILPNFLIAGEYKAGTTSAYYHLSKHPDICIGSKKELQLFDKGDVSLKTYESFFAPFYTGQKYILEASPGYFDQGATAAKRIKQMLPDPRILVLFRNPSQLLISRYLFRRQRNALTVNSLDELFESIKTERKDNWAANFLAYESLFGTHFKAAFFEDMVADYKSFFTALCDWLEVPCRPLIDIPFVPENRTFRARSPLFQRLYLQAVSMVKRNNLFFPRWFRVGLKNFYLSANAMDSAKIREEKTALQKAIKEAVVEYMSDELNEFAAILEDRGYQLPAWIQEYKK